MMNIAVFIDVIAKSKAIKNSLYRARLPPPEPTDERTESQAMPSTLSTMRCTSSVMGCRSPFNPAQSVIDVDTMTS